MKKKFELSLTIIGLISITAIALVLSSIERQQLENSSVIQLEQASTNPTEKDLVYQGYQDYRILEPQNLQLFGQEFSDGILSDWKLLESIDQDFLVSEIRLHEFNNTLRYIVLFETSPSGDWIRETEYYFTEEGDLGVLSSRLNTFYGNVSVLEERIYVDGQLIDQRKTTKDLDSLELVDRSYQDQPIQVFNSIEEVKNELNL